MTPESPVTTESPGDASHSNPTDVGTRRPLPDSFDKPQKLRRVGAHRAPKPASAAWLRALWIVLATAALTALGFEQVSYVLEPVAAAHFYAQRLTRDAVRSLTARLAAMPLVERLELAGLQPRGGSDEAR